MSVSLDVSDKRANLLSDLQLWLAQLVEGAQAKALYGLTLNYKPLNALVDRLLRDSTLSGEEVAEVLDGAGLVPFPDPFVEGFTWDENGRLVFPGMEDQVLLFFPSPARVHAPVWLPLLNQNG